MVQILIVFFLSAEYELFLIIYKLSMADAVNSCLYKSKLK